MPQKLTQRYNRGYFVCWQVVQHVYEAAVVAVGGEMVRYLLGDLQLIESASPVLREVCDRVTSLWRVPDLPVSVRYLLEFYQRRLEFEQEDLIVLDSCWGLYWIELAIAINTVKRGISIST